MTQPIGERAPGPRWLEATEPYASDALESSRAVFAAKHDGHYLCFTSEEALADTTQFPTLDSEGLAAEEGSKLHIVPIVKRDGANPFTMMITLGRAGNNDIRVPFEDISKFHAYLSRDGEDWVITDAGSTNGCFVGGVRLKARVPTPVQFGEEICLASVSARVVRAELLYDLLQPLPA